MEAWNVLQSGSIVLIIGELRGLDTDGPTFVKRLKADPQFQRIPVMIATGSAEQEAILMFERAGLSIADNVAGFLFLPCSTETIIAMVRSVIGPAT